MGLRVVLDDGVVEDLGGKSTNLGYTAYATCARRGNLDFSVRLEGVFQFRDLGPTAFFVMGAIDYVVNWYRPGGNLSIDEVAAEYADLALASLNC